MTLFETAFVKLLAGLLYCDIRSALYIQIFSKLLANVDLLFLVVDYFRLRRVAANALELLKVDKLAGARAWHEVAVAVADHFVVCRQAACVHVISEAE